MNDDLTSRREFMRLLLGAGALAAGCASPPAPKLPGEGLVVAPTVAGTGTIDAHIHLWSPDVKRYPRAPLFADQLLKPRRYTARDFLATARRTGVERAVLVQPGLYGTDHSYLIDVLRAYPQHFIGVGSVDQVAEPEVRLRELGRLGLRGARVVTHTGFERWIEKEHANQLFAVASEDGLVLDFLSRPEHLEVIDGVCEQYPDTLVVIDHLGRPRPGRYEREEDLETLCRMARHPRVHLKLSGFHMLAQDTAHYDELEPVFGRVLNEFGAERVMWGSDAPFQFRNGNTYTGSLDWVRSHTEASENDRDWLLRRTAESVFFT